MAELRHHFPRAAANDMGTVGFAPQNGPAGDIRFREVWLKEMEIPEAKIVFGCWFLLPAHLSISPALNPGCDPKHFQSAGWFWPQTPGKSLSFPSIIAYPIATGQPVGYGHGNDTTA